jgi:aspartyl-tRNA synthetase
MRKYSNEITPENDGSTVTVAGWAHEIRDLGGLRFILLRDRAGLVQVTLPKKFVSREVFETSRKISKESVDRKSVV